MEFQFQRLNLSLKCQEEIRLRSAELEIRNQEKQTKGCDFKRRSYIEDTEMKRHYQLKCYQLAGEKIE